MPLEDLKTVDWSDITSRAYAPPRDVLRQIRQLVFRTNTTSVTVNSLCEEICHQGDVFDTTVRTIPYFIELLRSLNPSHKRLREDLLMSLASFYTLCQGADYNLSSETQATERAEAEQRIMSQLRSAVRQGRAVYRICCDDLRLDVQRAALLLLGCLKEDAGYFLPYLSERITETNPADKSALFFCYARLAPFDERQSTLLPCFKNSRTPFPIRAVLAFILGETEEDKLYPLLSGLPCPQQTQVPSSVREFLDTYAAPNEASRYRLWPLLLDCVMPN